MSLEAFSPGQFRGFRTLGNSLAQFLSLLLLAVHAFAGQATLAWDANADPAVAGYMLYYGQATGSYSSKVDVGKQTTYTLPNLQEGRVYYYAVTAYDSSRTESGFSNEANKAIPYAAPAASFGANATSGVAPLAVTFTSTSTGNITGYSWNFGDGTSSTTQNPVHSYAAAGSYSVSLTVTGPGGSNTQTKSSFVTVSAPAPAPSPSPAPAAAPVASFTSDKTSGTAPLAVNFTSTSTGSITGYSWTFGDGSSSTAQNPSHPYAAAGTYTVTLTVSGSGGSNTMSKPSYVTVTQPTTTTTTTGADFAATPTTGVAPLAVKFTNLSTASTLYYRWDFGDGTISREANPAHTYTKPGVYAVTLKNYRLSGASTVTKSGYITVTSSAPAPAPAPAPSPSPTPSSRPGLVAAYGFDEGTGSTVSDLSGNGNGGTITGATWATGRFGKALSFNGTNSWVTVNDSASLDLTSGMTLEAWVYPVGSLSGWRSVVMKEEPTNCVYFLEASSDRNQPVTGLCGGGEQSLTAGTTLPLNAWSHLVATYDGSTQTLYVNGAQVATRAQTGAIRTSGGALRIGGNSTWGEYFQGLIDEIRIYNRALTPAEVQADMGTSVANGH